MCQPNTVYKIHKIPRLVYCSWQSKKDESRERENVNMTRRTEWERESNKTPKFNGCRQREQERRHGHLSAGISREASPLSLSPQRPWGWIQLLLTQRGRPAPERHAVHFWGQWLTLCHLGQHPLAYITARNSRVRLCVLSPGLWCDNGVATALLNVCDASMFKNVLNHSSPIVECAIYTARPVCSV